MRSKNECSRDYVKIHRSFVEDERLGYKEKGLLLCLLSLPDDFDFTIKNIIARFKGNTEFISRTIAAFEEYGYVVKRKRTHGNLVIGYDWELNDNPLRTD